MAREDTGGVQASMAVLEDCQKAQKRAEACNRADTGLTGRVSLDCDPLPITSCSPMATREHNCHFPPRAVTGQLLAMLAMLAVEGALAPQGHIPSPRLAFDRTFPLLLWLCIGVPGVVSLRLSSPTVLPWCFGQLEDSAGRTALR